MWDAVNGGATRTSLVVVGAVWLGALGCGDAGTGPVPDGDGRRLAAQFEQLADSVDSGGYSPTAEALRHAAEIVRLTGHATPVTLTIDGSARSFLAVAEQLDFPNLQCTWPVDSGTTPPPLPPDTVIGVPSDSGIGLPPDSTGVVPPDSARGDTAAVPPVPIECTVVGTFSMRTFIAWEPDHMAEVVRVVADVGSNAVETGVPDVMTELPSDVAASDPPPVSQDSSSGGGGRTGGYPGFMGEYLVRDVGSWWAVEGSQRNDLEASAGACTADRATFDWAEFSCEASRFRFELSMRVEPLQYERLTGVADPPGGPQGNHSLSLGSSSVDGVRLTVVAWTPPPLPPAGPEPDPLPGDSTGVEGPPSP